MLICDFWTLLLLCFLAPILEAENLRDPQFVARAETGFEHIFNMDYDEAEQIFTALGKDYPQHPAPPMYLASIRWVQEMERRQDLALNRFIAPTYFNEKTSHVMTPQERNYFFSKLQEAEALCKTILQKSPNDKDGRYFLSTIYGFRASFAITIDHSLREAFSHGNKCFSLSKQLTDEDPKYYDAYLTRGIYEYTVGLIPWYMRWMIYIIGVRGGKEIGLAHLQLAEKGQYVKDQAQLVSMVLKARENRYAEALEIARGLAQKFPRTYLFPINLAQILKLAGHKEEALTVLAQVEKRAERGEANFDKLPFATFRFQVGIELLHAEKLDPAKEHFTKTVSDPRASAREKTLSHLYLARILDWQWKPAEAIKEAEIVLSSPDIDNSYSQAKRLLGKLKTR